MTRIRSEKDKERWRQWQLAEKQEKREEQLEKRARTAGRQQSNEQKKLAFHRRLEKMADVCAHLGVETRILNGGIHIQFKCDNLVGNYYPTTNRLFIQNPGLGRTLTEIKHRDALVTFFQAARNVFETPELYSAYWEFDSSGQPPMRVRSETTEVASRLREAVLRVAAKSPKLLHGVDPREFEFLIAELLKDDGYETTVTQASRDGGRDIIAVQRLDSQQDYVLLVECKRFVERPVDIGIVQRIVGVRHINQADFAMVVTTSRFTEPAHHEALRVRDELSLVDQKKLQEWLISYDARRRLRL